MFYKNKIFIISISVLLVGIIGVFVYFNNVDNTYENNSVTELAILEETNIAEPVIEDIVKTVFVDIKGAVNKPGVYEVASDSIINDVLILAGGLNKNAHTNNINLSKKVTDEMVIYIYTNAEYQKYHNDDSQLAASTSTCNCSSYQIDNCIASGASIIVSGNELPNDTNNSSNTKDSKVVNINTASKEELQTLPGIKESKAQAIIDYRTKNGNFEKTDDITNVNGIGPSTYENIKDYITV